MQHLSFSGLLSKGVLPPSYGSGNPILTTNFFAEFKHQGSQGNNTDNRQPSPVQFSIFKHTQTQCLLETKYISLCSQYHISPRNQIRSLNPKIISSYCFRIHTLEGTWIHGVYTYPQMIYAHHKLKTPELLYSISNTLKYVYIYAIYVVCLYIYTSLIYILCISIYQSIYVYMYI